MNRTILAGYLSALAKDATQGPWEVTHSSWEISRIFANGTPVVDCHINWEATEDDQDEYETQKETNANLIVELVNNLPTILRALRERDQAVEALREIDALDGEINPSNYDHDDACYLNRQFCYAGTIASTTLASIEGTGHE